MICKFCSEDKELRKSHIIPEFFFRRYRPDDGTSLEQVSPRLHFKPRYRNGYYERLLCEACEALTAEWDNIGINFFQQFHRIDPKRYGDKAYFEINDFDYASLKLFFMSILWRASVSSLQFFSDVKLGPFEARLLEMLKNSDPGQPDDFGVVLFKYASSEDELEKIIISPTRYKPKGINHYRFRLNEHVFIVKVDRKPFSSDQRFFCMKDNEPLRIIEAEFSGSREMNNLIKVVHLHEDYKKNFVR